MMKTKEELLGERERLKNELVEVDKQIARHPDTIRDSFARSPSWKVGLEGCDELVGRVTFIKATSGHTDSRKNPVPWSGYVFEFEGKAYRIRHGENWCSEVLDCGPIDKEEPLDYDLVEALWDQEDPLGCLREGGVAEDWRLVGYLLTPSLDIF